MTNEQAKQEAIKKAWGNLYPMLDKIMIEEQNQRGGNWYANWKNSGRFYKNFLVDFVHFAVRDDLQNLNGFWWPESIKGIINNNGWIRIEPDGSNLPTDETKMYNAFHKPFINTRVKEFTAGAIKIDFEYGHTTHYKPITPEEPPVY